MIASLSQQSLSSATRGDYIELIVRGAFPLAISASSAAARNRWMDSNLRLTLERDVKELSNVRRGQFLCAGETLKVHMMDSGIAARLLRLTPAKLAQLDPTALTELGHLVETYLVGELLKQAECLDGVVGVGQWRTLDNDEVDLVVERDDGRVVGFDAKTGSRVSGKDLGPLRKFKSTVGLPWRIMGHVPIPLVAHDIPHTPPIGVPLFHER